MPTARHRPPSSAESSPKQSVLSGQLTVGRVCLSVRPCAHTGVHMP